MQIGSRYAHVTDERAAASSAANILETRETDLRDDGAELARRGGETVACRTVTGGERFSGYDESGGVGAEVLEEVGEAVEEDERLGRRCGGNQLLVAETHAAEEDGKDSEAHQLDRLAAPRVDEEESHPVTGNQAGDGQDHVADADVVEVGEDLQAARESGRRAAETDGVEDD